MTSDKAVAVLIISPAGIPLVRDPKKPAPIYWKLPGGRSEKDESAEDAAVREIKEELGLNIKHDDLRLIYKEKRTDHFLYVFKVEILNLPSMSSRGNEGEEVKTFKTEEVLSMPDFFPNHRKIIEMQISNLQQFANTDMHNSK